MKTKPIHYTIEVGTKRNTTEWFRHTIDLQIDRLSMLAIVGGLQLAVRHQDWGGPSKGLCTSIARLFAIRLINDGLEIPDDALNEWTKELGFEVATLADGKREATRSGPKTNQGGEEG